jgi:hypothetical protein
VQFNIISGIPMNTVENRELVRQLLNTDPDKLPWPQPYLDSARDVCQNCGLAIWIGPEVHRMMLNFIARAVEFRILCLICCAMLARDESSLIKMTILTDKKEGE